MTFEEAIESLYNKDLIHVCNVLNQGEHLCKLKGKDLLFIHTVFCCQLHTGTILEVLYSITNEQLYYLRLKATTLPPLGLPLTINTNVSPFQRKFYRKKIEWFDQFNIKNRSFHSVFADEVKVENSKVKSLLLANDEKTIVSHFSLYNEDDIIKKYPLCRSDTPILYHSYTDFSVYTPHIIKNSIEDEYFEDNYSRNEEKYGGYNDWSDDLIDDVFGGIPEATWNVD